MLRRSIAANEAILKFQARLSRPKLRFRQLKGRKNLFIINLARGDRIVLRSDANNFYAVLDVEPYDNVCPR